jgi:protein O-mannosyl-transferase
MKALPLLQAALIVLAGWLAVSPALRGDWLWDDHEIRDNPDMASLAGLGRAWVSPAANDYYPVETTFLWAGRRLWGDAPAGYHAANLLLHLAGALLVWRLLGRLGVRWAWAGGLVFAAHPLAVESVAWISEVKNTLSLPLLLLSLLAYLNVDRGRHPAPSYLASLILFLAALLSKSSVVMFPVVLLAFAWWRRGRVGWADLRALVPFLVLAAALGLVTVHFQAARAIRDWHVPAIGLPERIADAGLSLGFYAWKSVLPAGLMPVYPGWPGMPAAAAGFAVWLVFAVVVIALARRPGPGRAAAFGLACFSLNLLPVLGFVPMSFQHIAPVADHFAYVSLVAVAGLAAAGLGAIRPAWPRLAATLAVAGALVASSRAHSRIFTSQETLWRANAALNPDSAIVRTNLGFVLHAAGKLGESVENYKAAARLNPADGEIEDELAGVLAAAGLQSEANAHLARAVADYRRDLREHPDLHDTHGRLGIALAALGRGPEAAEELEKAVRLDPNSFKVRNNLANVLVGLPGRLPEALEHYEAAVRMEPGNALVHANLGYALLASGRPGEAVRHYEEAVRLDPGSPDWHNNLGYALAQLGRYPEAREQFQAVLRLRPDDADARSNLARLPQDHD